MNDIKILYDAIQKVEIIGTSGLKPEVLDEIAHYPYVDTRAHKPSTDEDDSEGNPKVNPNR